MWIFLVKLTYNRFSLANVSTNSPDKIKLQLLSMIFNKLANYTFILSNKFLIWLSVFIIFICSVDDSVNLAYIETLND